MMVEGSKKEIKVGLIYGGQSFEHEVSKMTAKSIEENIDTDKFSVLKIYVDEKGNFDQALLKQIDVAFLAVHGPNCEDGRFQQFLEDRGVAYTGAGVEASRVNMDKVAQHEVFAKAGLLVTKFIKVNASSEIGSIKDKVSQEIGYPCFVKPRNGGSSVGMSKVEEEKDLDKAIGEARKCDETITIEAAIIKPREIEIGILGNDELIVSEPGEIISNGEFYSYKTKYFEPFETTTKPKLSEREVKLIKEMAVTAYRATGCAGYARVDFFLDQNGKIFINEINTLPGFTKISMYPKMMSEIGIPYQDLITKIIDLAMEKVRA